MWSELDLEQLEKEEYTHVPMQPLTQEELDETVEFVFYHFYNSGKPCQPVNIRKWFKDRSLKPCPSKVEITSILKKREAPVY